jgi:hypothetical protein
MNLLFGPLKNHGATAPTPNQNNETTTIGIAASAFATTILFLYQGKMDHSNVETQFRKMPVL